MNISRLAVTLMLLFAGTSFGAIKMQPVELTLEGRKFVGQLAYDDTTADKRPGVIVVHEWWGLNDYPKSRAEQLAKLGYVALCVDMFGEGKTTTDPKQAQAWMEATVKDPKALASRFNAWLDTFKKQPQLDSSRIAAIGYCFGGGVCLNMARSGADLKGVVSFHGSLEPASGPAQKGAVKAKILACHGADDPFEPADSVAKFQKEMTDAGADWQLNIYSHAVHAFTNPKVDEYKLPGAAYNAEADQRSWSAMTAFFDEIFSQPKRKFSTTFRC